MYVVWRGRKVAREAKKKRLSDKCGQQNKSKYSRRVHHQWRKWHCRNQRQAHAQQHKQNRIFLFMTFLNAFLFSWPNILTYQPNRTKRLFVPNSSAKDERRFVDFFSIYAIQPFYSFAYDLIYQLILIADAYALSAGRKEAPITPTIATEWDTNTQASRSASCQYMCTYRAEKW